MLLLWEKRKRAALPAYGFILTLEKMHCRAQASTTELWIVKSRTCFGCDRAARTTARSFFLREHTNWLLRDICNLKGAIQFELSVYGRRETGGGWLEPLILRVPNSLPFLIVTFGHLDLQSSRLSVISKSQSLAAVAQVQQWRNRLFGFASGLLL